MIWAKYLGFSPTNASQIAGILAQISGLNWCNWFIDRLAHTQTFSALHTELFVNKHAHSVFQTLEAMYDPLHIQKEEILSVGISRKFPT